jgi:cytochrome P450
VNSDNWNVVVVVYGCCFICDFITAIHGLKLQRDPNQKHDVMQCHPTVQQHHNAKQNNPRHVNVLREKSKRDKQQLQGIGRHHMRAPLALYSDSVMEDALVGDGKRAVKRYLPFSEGPRSCAGMSLAKVNMTATLA